MMIAIGASTSVLLLLLTISSPVMRYVSASIAAVQTTLGH